MHCQYGHRASASLISGVALPCKLQMSCCVCGAVNNLKSDLIRFPALATHDFLGRAASPGRTAYPSRYRALPPRSSVVSLQVVVSEKKVLLVTKAYRKFPHTRRTRTKTHPLFQLEKIFQNLTAYLLKSCLGI